MFKAIKNKIKCIFDSHDAVYWFSLPNDNRKVFRCKRCAAIFTVNGLTHKQERVHIIWQKEPCEAARTV